MEEKERHEKVRFMMFVEEQLALLTELFGDYFSDEALRIMKRIYTRLRLLILTNELQRVERRRMSGKITGKQAVGLKAKLKKMWR